MSTKQRVVFQCRQSIFHLHAIIKPHRLIVNHCRHLNRPCIGTNRGALSKSTAVYDSLIFDWAVNRTGSNTSTLFYLNTCKFLRHLFQLYSTGDNQNSIFHLPGVDIARISILAQHHLIFCKFLK